MMTLTEPIETRGSVASILAETFYQRYLDIGILLSLQNDD
jgi:hypothetical protein